VTTVAVEDLRMTLEELVPNIPRPLISRDQWVAWRHEERDGKLTKVPYQPVNPARGASATDPGTWGLFEEALVAEPRDGIGFVVTEHDPFCGVDLDHCRDPKTGEIDRWAQQIIADLMSYTEITPSADGLRVWLMGEKPGRNARKRVDGGGEIEIYDRARMFAVTGNHVAGLPRTIEARQAELAKLYADLWPEPEPKPRPVQPVGVDDHVLLERMFAAANGEKIRRLFAGDTSDHGGDDSSADMALCMHLAFWTGRDAARMDALFRMSGLMRPKWDERRRDSTYGADTIEKAIAGTADVYQGELDAVSRLAVPAVGGVAGSISADPNAERQVVPVPTFMPATKFVRLEFPVPELLVGTSDHTVLFRGSLLMLFGPEAAGKTTAVIDMAAHTAAGLPWLDLPVVRPVRWLLIENESAPGMFAQLLKEKQERWDADPAWFENVHVQGGEGLWGFYSFRQETHRQALWNYCREHRIDVVAANPTFGVGGPGAGRPDETQEFVDTMLRPVGLWDDTAFVLLHHENKAGGSPVIGDGNQTPSSNSSVTSTTPAQKSPGKRSDTPPRLIRGQRNNCLSGFRNIRGSTSATSTLAALSPTRSSTDAWTSS